MATTTNNVPLWLDIKTEYIDENFEKVLEYLKSGNKNDAFYQTTIELLGKRVEEYLKTLKTRPAYFSENPSNYDKNKLMFESRLVASYLLANKNIEALIRKRLYMPLLNSLSLLVEPELCDELLGLMMDNILYENEPALLFGWDDIITFEPQILVHKMINGTVFRNPKQAELAYENKGAITVIEGAMGIAATNKDGVEKKKAQLASSISILDGRLKILASKNDKIKQADEGNIEVIEKFTRKFIQDQLKVSPSKAKGPRKTYMDGDNLCVAITSVTWGKIKVKSIDPEYEVIEGTVDFSEPVYPNYFPEDFYKYLKEGQIIDVTLMNYKKSLFSLKDGFITYIIEDVVKEGEHFGKSVLGEVIRIYEDKRNEKQMDWWSSLGYPVHTQYDDRFEKGDFGYIKVAGLGDKDYYGYIYAEITNKSTLSFDIQATKKAIIEGFNFLGYEEEEVKENILNTPVIRDLLNMLIRYQKTIVQPTERFKALCVSNILATLIGSQEHMDYTGFMMEYLKQLIYFAKDEYDKIGVITASEKLNNVDVVKTKCDVVRILKAYGHGENNAELDSIMEQTEDQTLAKIAKLIQSCNIIGEIVPASTKNIIKREIVNSLSLETEDETNLEEENGIYLGIENLHQEFKTSFVYPPDNDMQPNVAIQEKNIFKCLCGFLNSDGGGTLYIGVTDLGYVCGFDNDMRHLKLNELDSYIRFIQDEAAKFFPVDVLNQFVIKPMYEDKVVSIRVEPYTDGIVEFDGKPYIRINNETREMNDKLKKMVKAKKTAK